MASVVDRYAQEIRENVPVVYNGLTLHPLTVRDYDLYLRAKPAFEIMQASLGVPKLARLPWGACLWALDETYRQNSGQLGHFLSDVLLVLAKALRLDAYADAGNGGKESYPIRPLFANGDLTAIVVGMPPNNAVLDMRQMSDIRAILAAQNGYEIPDENWNPELVRAAQENEARGGLSVDGKLETLVYSVAFQCKCRPADVYGWTIRELQGMQAAADRSLNYVIYTMAEASGNVKFEKGNPFPTWKFNRKSDMPTGFRTIADIDAGAKGLIAGT